MENNNSMKLVCEERGADCYVESSAEYILPDYNPDVRKLLYTACEVKPAGRFSADEQVDFSGIVEYRCIYADKDGELSEISFNSDYEYGVSLAGGAIDADSQPWVQNYQIRVLGPRKIAAKASIMCENIYTTEHDNGGEGICDGEDIELEKKTVQCGRLKRVESDERELAEEISRLDGVALDEISIMSAYAEALGAEINRDGNSARCKSEFKIKLIYRDSDGQIVPLESTLTGEGEISLDGIPEDAGIVCTPHILSERFECLPTEDGVNMVANFIVKWDACCVYNEEHSIVTDGYSTDFALDNRYASVNLVRFSAPVREQMSYEGNCAFDGGEYGRVKEVLVMGGRARINEKKIEDGELNICMDLKIQGVISCYDGGGNVTYAPVKISENIAKKVNLSSKKCDAKGTIVRISGVKIMHKIDGEDIKCILLAELDIIPYEEIGERVLVGAERNENEKFERTTGRVTVYYTEPCDTLFSVAKKYHTTASALIENNEITAEVIAGEERLTLPKRLIIY